MRPSPQKVGMKFSSAFIPPEMVYQDEENTTAADLRRGLGWRVKGNFDYDDKRKSTNKKDANGCLLLQGKDGKGEHIFKVEKASRAFDLWSFGVVLYKMAHPTGATLFQSDRDDNLTMNHLGNLGSWPGPNGDSKRAALDEIEDDSARDLLEKLLMRKAADRPRQMNAILKRHPFFSGEQQALHDLKCTDDDGVCLHVCVITCKLIA